MGFTFSIDMERRSFVKYLGTIGLGALIAPELLACEKLQKLVTDTMGADFNRGHLLRQPKSYFDQFPVVKKNQKIVIVGGGISGLSAAYHLKQNLETEFVLLEMDQRTGGNSGSNENEYTKFPLGAHYLSLPNQDNLPLIDFLKKEQLIIGEKDGKYIYHEQFLCHAPNERLFYRGRFQEGLVPEYGISKKTQDEIKRFFDWMKSLKQETNDSGKQVFAIPISNCDYTPHLKELDNITFKAFLDKHGFKSPELCWFLDYCCRDDFGAGYDTISAWAGVHYFAARKADPVNADPTSVLTWPEGNDALGTRLRSHFEGHCKTDQLVYDVQELKDHVLVRSFNFKEKTITEYSCEQCIMATPSYVNKHVLHATNWPKSFFEGIKHQPWFIGIVVVTKIPHINGLPLAWDNVAFGTKGLGYIYNQHQKLNISDNGPHVLSVYITMDKAVDEKERRKLFEMTESEMANIVIDELKTMHPDIEQEIVKISFQKWGHGMVTPYPGSLAKHHEFVERSKNASRTHLAHTDFSSYSVFEEGFEAGRLAALKLMNYA